MKTIGQPNSVLACKCIASFKSVFVMPEMPDIWTQQILKSSDCATWSFDSEDTCGLSQPLGALQPPRAALTWPSCSRSPLQKAKEWTPSAWATACPGLLLLPVEKTALQDHKGHLRLPLTLAGTHSSWFTSAVEPSSTNPLLLTRWQVCLHFPTITIGIGTRCPQKGTLHS